MNLLLPNKGKTGSLVAEAARTRGQLAVRRLHQIFFGDLDPNVFA